MRIKVKDSGNIHEATGACDGGFVIIVNGKKRVIPQCNAELIEGDAISPVSDDPYELIRDMREEICRECVNWHNNAGVCVTVTGCDSEQPGHADTGRQWSLEQQPSHHQHRINPQPDG